MSVRTFGRNASRIMDSSAVLLCRINLDGRRVFYPGEVHSGLLYAQVLIIIITKLYIFSFCSYSGKTQKQIIEFVRENYVKRQNFQR